MPISQLSFIRTTVTALLVGLAALLAIVAVNLWLVRQARVYSNTVTAARLQRSAVVDLRNMLDDAETGQRGYLLTGDPVYLDPFINAKQSIPAQLDRVRTLMANASEQKGPVAKLVPIVNEKLAELQRAIDLFNAGKRDDALASVRTNQGLVLMQNAKGLLVSIVERAEADIDRAVRNQRRSIAALQWVTIFGALVIVLVVGGSVWAVVVYTRQLVEAQQEVTSLNAGLEQRVRERTADVGRANEEIQRFAYIVTHDLRSPLVNIMGFTSELEGSLATIQNYIREPNVPDENAAMKDARFAALEELPEAISFIRSSTRKMDGLINAILKLSREGRRVLKPETIDLDGLFKTAAESVQHQITEAGGDVEIDVKAPAIVSDRLALEQIFGNLLDNAVKYRSPQRPLKIRIRTATVPGRGIVVEVEDNGRGIAEQDHERVFDLFRRSGAQDRQGEGIGLAHVRTMVRNLGGEITLQSGLGRGTTMKLRLPRDLRDVMAVQKGAA